MSSTTLDEFDKLKEMWAYNMPCLLLINSGRKFWTETARPVYVQLTEEILQKVRSSLAASLHEIAKLVDLRADSAEEDRVFFIKVMNQLLADNEEVKMKLMPNLCDLLLLFPEDN